MGNGSLDKELSKPLADGGERMTFEGGGEREPDTGKGRFDLISPYGLTRLARRYELGAIKYALRNWEKGIPVSRCINSAMRHLVQYVQGDDAEDHLAAAAWNLFAIMHYEAILPEMMDLPTRYWIVKKTGSEATK